jgi:hypothetical protein
VVESALVDELFPGTWPECVNRREGWLGPASPGTATRRSAAVARGNAVCRAVTATPPLAEEPIGPVSNGALVG